MVVVGLAWPMLVWLTPASDRPVGLGHERQQHLVADPRLQRPRPALRAERRPGRRRRRAGRLAAAAGLFGGEPGALRLLNQSLGGQAGWLLGFALVGGASCSSPLTRLRRADPRTGWMIAVGGAFLVTAVAFSQAQGIFHPYYVSALAPFTAALVGAGRGAIAARRARGRGSSARSSIAGGVVTELVVLHASAGGPDWVIPLLVAVAVAAPSRSLGPGRPGRGIAVAVALGVLLLARPPGP